MSSGPKTNPHKANAHTVEEDSDGDLLARLKAKDIAALGPLFDRHAASVHQFARRVAPREDADDIVQETFLRVAKIAASYEARMPSARAWIVGVGYSVIRERRRAVARFIRALSSFARTESERVALPRGAVRNEIEKQLALLSPDKREAIVLTEVLGMTGPEAASVLGIPVGTLWTRLHHARQTLLASTRREDV